METGNLSHQSHDLYKDIMKLLNYLYSYMRMCEYDEDIELPLLVSGFTFDNIVKTLGIIPSILVTRPSFDKRIQDLIDSIITFIEDIKSNSDIKQVLGMIMQKIVYVNNYYQLFTLGYNNIIDEILSELTEDDIKFYDKGYNDTSYTDYNPYNVRINYYASVKDNKVLKNIKVRLHDSHCDIKDITMLNYSHLLINYY